MNKDPLSDVQLLYNKIHILQKIYEASEKLVFDFPNVYETLGRVTDQNTNEMKHYDDLCNAINAYRSFIGESEFSKVIHHYPNDGLKILLQIETVHDKELVAFIVNRKCESMKDAIKDGTESHMTQSIISGLIKETRGVIHVPLLRELVTAKVKEIKGR